MNLNLLNTIQAIEILEAARRKVNDYKYCIIALEDLSPDIFSLNREQIQNTIDRIDSQIKILGQHRDILKL